MKRIVSISIGSSSRDKSVETDILGERYLIERIGTNGDMKKAIALIKELDGKVDAFGMGGIDLYLSSKSGGKYLIKQALPIMQAAKNTPIVDGTGIKNTLEKRIIEYLDQNGIIQLKNAKVLVTCAIDRYKMAEGFIEAGADVVIGDLIFALGIPVPIRKLETLELLAKLLMPLISRLPFEMLYPTGEKQKENDNKKYKRFYEEADIIAGDYHYIKKYMPLNMLGKMIVTNTATLEDVEMLRNRGVATLVTTTPEWDGRSFGTNVIEAILVSATGKKPRDLTEADYYGILDKLDFKPRVEYLNRFK